MQLMQVYVQKSTSTTRPRKEASVRDRLPGVLNHSSVLVKSGAVPILGSPWAIASRLAWLALRGAEGVEALCWNLVLCPLISDRRLCTAWDFSMLAVRLTSG